MSAPQLITWPIVKSHRAKITLGIVMHSKFYDD